MKTAAPISEEMLRSESRPRFNLAPVPDDENRLERRRRRARERTAAWRISNDRKGRPELNDIGRALLAAACSVKNSPENHEIIQKAVQMLVDAGFDGQQTFDVLTRARKRIISHSGMSK